VNRVGLTPIRDAAASGLDVSATDTSRHAPAPGETLHEIGMLLALHLAFAFAVVLMLQAFGAN
jgi:hypothetical protein